MERTVDYYFSPISPFSFLGHAGLGEVTRRHGAAVRIKPVDLGRVFKATGGLPLSERPPARRAYRLVELRRFARAAGIPLNPEPKYFPRPDRDAALAIIAADEAGADAFDLTEAVMRAVWVEERDIADPAVLDGIFGKEIMERSREPHFAQRREANTDEAIARGVFGAPSYLFDGELFWGQDRLEFLDRALAAR